MINERRWWIGMALFVVAAVVYLSRPPPRLPSRHHREIESEALSVTLLPAVVEEDGDISFSTVGTFFRPSGEPIKLFNFRDPPSDLHLMCTVSMSSGGTCPLSTSAMVDDDFHVRFTEGDATEERCFEVGLRIRVRSTHRHVYGVPNGVSEPDRSGCRFHLVERP